MTDLHFYLFCFAAGAIFAVASALAGHIFDCHHGSLHGSGGHAEAGFDSGDMPGISAFSPTIIASFITAFGGLGAVLHQLPWTREVWISTPLALLGGLGIASCVLTVMRWLFRRTQGSSESRVASLVGVSATVITPIPENGVGEIAYVQAGSRYTAAARMQGGAPVASGRTVKIARVTGSQFHVVAES
ncbi:MAG TPA: NfeD family protein [Verrucomicrobiae bacterium]|nr:NfeD family protein [Verrucomicrobiae bacterium]